jgi:hypothetical protein
VAGNLLGSVFPLGKFTVAAAGTSIPLSTNVSVNTGSAPGSAIAVPATANEIIVSAPSTNTGDVYLTFGAGNSSTLPVNGTGVVFAVAKGTTQRLSCPVGTSPFQLALFGIDGPTGAVAYVCAVNI